MCSSWVGWAGGGSPLSCRHGGQEIDVNWCDFYDDYPTLSFRALAENPDHTIRGMLHLLGFVSALDKEMDFAAKSDLLGVTLDLGGATCGTVFVGKKASRVADLKQSVEWIIAEKKVSPRTLPSLFGRGLFVERNLLGRSGRLALACLRYSLT